MHEMAIAVNVVELASGRAAEYGGRVAAITLRIGRLSSIHEASLRSSFDIAREGTPLADAELRIVALPVRIWCPSCRAERELPDIQRFTCPDCGTRSSDIRSGLELDLESIELVETTDP